MISDTAECASRSELRALTFDIRFHILDRRLFLSRQPFKCFERNNYTCLSGWSTTFRRYRNKKLPVRHPDPSNVHNKVRAKAAQSRESLWLRNDDVLFVY